MWGLTFVIKHAQGHAEGLKREHLQLPEILSH